MTRVLFGALLTAFGLGAQYTPPWGTSGNGPGGSGTLAPTTYVEGVPLTGASYPVVKGLALAAGDTDVYTVPAGKRAWIVAAGAYNPTAGAIAIFPELKVAGVYYRLAATLTPAATTAASLGALAIILEAGESLSLNAGSAGLNYSISVIQFDSTSRLRTVKLSGVATGNNTVYTAASNVTGFSQTLSATVVHTTAMAVAGGPVFLCAVSSGSPATCAGANAINQIALPASGAVNFQAAGFNFNTGDLLVVNMTTGDPQQLIWLNVLEM